MAADGRANISRMQFLRGELGGGSGAVRPPWALSETRFTEVCERCDTCLGSCSKGLLKRGRGGYPQVDFAAGGCSFCGDCVRACEHGALSFGEDPAAAPWQLDIDIAASCISLHGTICRFCGEICEEGAIRFRLELGGVARPILALDECSRCGACVSVCPVGSISLGRTQTQELVRE